MAQNPTAVEIGRPADSSGIPRPSTLRSRLRAIRSSLRGFMRVMRANPLTLVGFILVMVISVTALLVVALPAVTQVLLGTPISILPYDPSLFTTDYHVPPSAAHWLGTDHLGRDMLSRVLAALPLDLVIGFSVTGFALVVGVVLGLIAGYWDKPRTVGGIISVIILRVTDIFLAFPSLVLALAVAAALGRGTGPAILAVMVTWWPYYVRLTRGEVLAVKHLPYVMAARSAGVSEWKILIRHVLRNVLEPIIVYYTMDVGTVIVTFSTISYIGIGVPSSVPEWGSMVESYKPFLLTYPWTVLATGGAIFVTVLAFSLLGDGLRDILDPRSRRVLTQAAATSRAGTAAAATSSEV